jgi:hypothetical protein
VCPATRRLATAKKHQVSFCGRREWAGGWVRYYSMERGNSMGVSVKRPDTGMGSNEI